jgi:hypothetical protein
MEGMEERTDGRKEGRAEARKQGSEEQRKRGKWMDKGIDGRERRK